MPPKRASASVAVGKSLEERRDAARDAALKELKALRTDCAALEAVLTGRRKSSEISLFDLTHGALEIFRHASAAFEAEALLAACAREIEEVKALEYLERHGATELVKPAGWHWISPKGEMHCLAKADEPGKAAARLSELLQGTRRVRRREKTAEADESPAATDAPAPGEVGTDESGEGERA